MSATGDLTQDEAWEEAESAVVALMGTINRSMAQLVVMIRMLLDTGAWAGHGIRSIEHWVMWKACASHRRATDLVRIARRIDDLPICWGRFERGELTEEAMALIARVVPAARDGEVAGWAPLMTMSQLRRALRSCPETPAGADKQRPEPVRERSLRTWTDDDGWGGGSFSLPPDEMALLDTALSNARDAEFRDRNGLAADDDAKGAWRVE